MAAVLVDSAVLLDVMTRDPQWFAWSASALAREADRSRLIVNAVVYAEISVRFTRIEDLEAALPRGVIEREPIPYEAAFLAGKAFLIYRRRGGTRRSPLPDFLIGAHAAVAGHRLLTRDAARFRTYFPGLPIICPG
jgi:predicted nucleic acid-binding protein